MDLLQTAFIFTLAGLTGAAVGNFAAYLAISAAEKRLSIEKVEEILEDEPEDWQQDMEEVEKISSEEPSDPKYKALLEPTKPAVDYTGFHKPDLEALASKYKDEQAAAKEMEKEEKEPYVITIDVYLASENRAKEVLTYYEADDTLVNSAEEIVQAKELIGEHGLEKFGSGSQDPDVVYIRNEADGTDYEVTMSHASYSESVLGVKKQSKSRRKKNAVPKDDSSSE